jgi:hypothetical protein
MHKEVQLYIDAVPEGKPLFLTVTGTDPGTLSGSQSCDLQPDTDLQSENGTGGAGLLEERRFALYQGLGIRRKVHGETPCLQNRRRQHQFQGHRRDSGDGYQEDHQICI